MEFALREATSGSKRDREGSALSSSHGEVSAPTHSGPRLTAHAENSSTAGVTLEEDSDDDDPIIPSSKRRRKSRPTDTKPAAKSKASNAKERVPAAEPSSLPAVVDLTLDLSAVPRSSLGESSAVRPSSPHPSDASTSSMPGSPTRSPEASVASPEHTQEAEGSDAEQELVVLDYDSPYKASVVIQPRKDGRPVRPASTVASLQSKVTVESEKAPDDAVLGLQKASVLPPAEIDLTGADTDQQSGSRVVQGSSKGKSKLTAVPSGKPKQRMKVSAKVTKTQLNQLPKASAAAPKTGLVPVPESKALSRPDQAAVATKRAQASDHVIPETLSLEGTLLSAPFASPGAELCWKKILETRSGPPVPNSTLIECSVDGIKAFADWTNPNHPHQEFLAQLPEWPCLFDASDYMPDVVISIRASVEELAVKLWRQFCSRAFGATENSDLGFALYERDHWIAPAAVDRWLRRLGRKLGKTHPVYCCQD
ncbi:hypothetical protein PHYSODRAFT_510838 [Phytophthora sojae]|uniref:Uncharacterized protein n=1 Tax=Phytophthora sojae (strain P6497) TaxID=1094619 RepID=G4ZU47_PHYSP|nr:hypothetical protein PHYSODRAFT_510838 [Phytophthora sojae]EGZ13321.1 hypothetical protein PHYSODRAFT_510838 [Phytophthora sojae]|eukprot:XP_009530750.1 hypothetical protein PHYSODRAFT_510838 [Phytophthora sojae]